MGRGIIDFVGQFRALAQAGYSGTMSLETHWRGAGSPEESSRQSWAGMRSFWAKLARSARPGAVERSWCVARKFYHLKYFHEKYEDLVCGSFSNLNMFK